MKNIEMELNGDILVIKVDLSKKFGLSGSGKNNIIASSEVTSRCLVAKT
jgi:hypothetical protein